MTICITAFSNTAIANTTKDWTLQYIGGLNQIIVPVDRVTIQNSLVIRYALNSKSAISLQIGHNYSLQNNLHDFRIGLRYQFELLRW